MYGWMASVVPVMVDMDIIIDQYITMASFLLHPSAKERERL